jgi:hypothetical protein
MALVGTSTLRKKVSIHLILGGATVHRCVNQLLSERALQMAEKLELRIRVWL